MGKGDKKTTKGKRAMGSYGNTRKKKKKSPKFVAVSEKTTKKDTTKKAVAKKTTTKKTTAKKTTTKKTSSKKED